MALQSVSELLATDKKLASVDHHHSNHQASVDTVLVLALVVHHSNHQASVDTVLVLVAHHSNHQASHHHHQAATVLVLDSVLVLMLLVLLSVVLIPTTTAALTKLNLPNSTNKVYKLTNTSILFNKQYGKFFTFQK